MNKSSEHIEEEIDGIRDRMRNRIDSASREFSPRAIAARITGTDDPSTSELVDWAIGKASANPVATALVTAGLIGFATQSSERTRLVSGADVKRGSGKLRSYAQEAREAAKGYAHDAADIAVEAADDAAHHVREQADRASRAISRTAQEAEDAARYAADRTVEYGREGADWVKRNPTATGLFALAIGAAAASIFAARRSHDPIADALGFDEDDDTAAQPARRKRASAKSTAGSTATRTRAKRGATADSATAKGSAGKSSAKSTKGATTRTRRKRADTSTNASSAAEETAVKARATRATRPAAVSSEDAPATATTDTSDTPATSSGSAVH